MTTTGPTSASNALPASDLLFWGEPLAMQVNWKNPVTVRTGFQTRIEHALTMSEQRRLLRGTPRRSISCTLTGTGRVETLAARQLLTRRSAAGFLMPLYSDQMELDSDYPAGSEDFFVGRDYIRFFEGSYVMLMQRKNGVVTAFEVVATSGDLPGEINLVDPSTIDMPKGSVILPLMACSLVDNYSNGFVLTDDKADFQNFTAQETVGVTQIASIATVGSNPSGFSTFQSLPVFDGPVDYSQIRFGINRIGAYSDVGIGETPVFYGERGVQQFSALMTFTTREEAWDFLRFFESRGGRAYPFFFRSPWQDYSYQGKNGNNLLVEDTGEIIDWNFRPYLAMELSNGTYDYREIESVVQNGTNHEISFVGGAALGDVVAARQLFKVRMYRDEVAERWITTDRCQMTLECIELLEEKQVTMTETLAAPTGTSVIDNNDDQIALGIGVSYDTTTATSPDLSIGGCQPFLLLYANNTTPPQDNIVSIDTETGLLTGVSSHIASNDFATNDDSTGGSFVGNWFLVARDLSVTDYYLHNLSTGNTTTISLGLDESQILSDENAYRVDSDGNSYVLLKYQYDTVNLYHTYYLRKYNKEGTELWSHELGQDDATYPAAFDIISLSKKNANGRIAFCYQDKRASLAVRVRVIETTNGTQIYDFPLETGTFYDCQIKYNVENNTEYIYALSNFPRTWAGVGSGNCELAKFNMAGGLVWEYETNETNIIELAIANNRVYVGKQRGNTHAGQINPATVLALDYSGTVVLEMDGGASFPIAEYLDVDPLSGDAVYSDSFGNGLCCLDGTTGSIKWSMVTPTVTWGISGSMSWGEFPLLYRDGGN